MAFTYEDSLPTEKDIARARLGDTDMAKPLLSDEHIDAVLIAEGGLAAGVAALAQELVVQFARKPVQIKAGNVTVDYRERIPQWQKLAARSLGVTADGESIGTMSVPIQSVW